MFGIAGHSLFTSILFIQVNILVFYLVKKVNVLIFLLKYALQTCIRMHANLLGTIFSHLCFFAEKVYFSHVNP